MILDFLASHRQVLRAAGTSQLVVRTDTGIPVLVAIDRGDRVHIATAGDPNFARLLVEAGVSDPLPDVVKVTL